MRAVFKKLVPQVPKRGTMGPFFQNFVHGTIFGVCLFRFAGIWAKNTSSVSPELLKAFAGSLACVAFMLLFSDITAPVSNAIMIAIAVTIWMVFFRGLKCGYNYDNIFVKKFPSCY